MKDTDKRPVWMNWAYLGIFLFSTWELYVLWGNKLGDLG